LVKNDLLDILVIPYIYLLNRGIRNKVGIKLKGKLIILDEAHNI